MLDVSPASANEMIGKLENRGLLNHEKYKGVDLTDDGIAQAREALQNYCIIERFLIEVLEVEEFQAEAKQLEGVIDETVADRSIRLSTANRSVRTVSTPRVTSVACSKSRPKSPATDRPLSKRSSAFRRLFRTR